MKNIRKNIFETNSSSSHSITIENDELVSNEMPIVNDFEICEGEDTLLVKLSDFCGSHTHNSQSEKLAYLILQLAYITDNEYATGWYGNSEKIELDREKLYETDEFKDLEDSICGYVGCKYVRIDPNTEGYIDHESVCYSIEELQSNILYRSYVSFVFAKDSFIQFEYNG